MGLRMGDRPGNLAGRDYEQVEGAGPQLGAKSTNTGPEVGEVSSFCKKLVPISSAIPEAWRLSPLPQPLNSCPLFYVFKIYFIEV